MTALLSLIPNIIFNLVVGYCFIFVLNLVLIKKNNENIEHNILQSFIIGYIYCLISYMLPTTNNIYLDNIGIILSAVIVAYFIGRIIQSSMIVKILDFLKIKKNRDNYIWNELLDQNYSMIACIEYSDKIYEGYIHECEDFSNTPTIALCLCEIKDKDGNIIKDHKEKTNEIVLLDSSKAQSITLLYDSRSSITEDISHFL